MKSDLHISNNDSYDLVVGLGKSGFAVARFLLSLGKKVKAVDLDTGLVREKGKLEELDAEVVLGPHPQEFFDEAATIFVSPGIPLDIPQIQRAVARGVKISGELDLFFEHNATPVVAVTGTNGKTTTVELIAAMLKESGQKVFTGGNIGTPLMEYLMGGKKADVVVAEVSSFQLDLAGKFSPNVGVLLNIAEDHLDRYPDFDAYKKSKYSLFRRQAPEDAAVVNALIEDECPDIEIQSSVLKFGWKKEGFAGEGVHAEISSRGISLQGIAMMGDENDGKFLREKMSLLELPHNRENVAAAVLASLCAGATFSGIKKAITNFRIPAHRLAMVREINGVQFYDDSKATNIHAVLSALKAFEFSGKDAGIHLILGGKEKGLDFTSMLPLVKEKVRQILAIGETASQIVEIFSKVCSVTLCRSMKDAVQKAAQTAVKNDVVLLSPACASFDMYSGYRERGEDFTRLVLSL